MSNLKNRCKFWQLYGGLMATSSKRAYAIPRSTAPRAPAPAAVHCWPVPPQESPNKVMLKILQARLQWYVNHEIPDVQARLRKGRGTRDQIANICWIIKKSREFQKNITSALLIMPNLLPMWITANCGKFFKRWEYQTPHLFPEKSVCRSRSHS